MTNNYLLERQHGVYVAPYHGCSVPVDPIIISGNVPGHPSVAFAIHNILSVFPNPVSDEINVQMDEAIDHVRSIGQDGRILMHINEISDGIHRIDVSTLPHGVYYITAFTTDGQYYYSKNIKY